MGFWTGRRVFLTGHTGFKGAWLSLWLAEEGAEVFGYSLPPPTDPSLFEAARVGEVVRHVEGDVRDLAALTEAYAEARPEVVFHLAAQPLVRLSYSEPLETYATNVMGTLNLLEAARRVGGARAIVCVTSDKCYENRETHTPYREGDPMGGHDPYSSSKGCAELAISAWRRSFFDAGRPGQDRVGLASARAGNVIGGGDWAQDRLIPDIIRSLANKRRPVIRNPQAIRPWQHVLEPLRGYMMIAERLCEGDARFADGWNFGPAEEDARPVRWIVGRLMELWGERGGWDQPDGVQPHEAGILKLDCSKAQEELGWVPAWDLETALENIVAWHRAELAGADMRTVTLGQIRDYAAAARSIVSPSRRLTASA